jgi:hypothetical protein
MRMKLTVCCVVWLQVIELPLKHPELFESLGIAQPKVRPVYPQGSSRGTSCAFIGRRPHRRSGRVAL